MTAERESTSTKTIVETKRKTRTKLAPRWHVTVHDDPITLMSYMTMALRRTFGFPYPQAYKLMMRIHTTGRAIVWTGNREHAELYVQKLHSQQLLATLDPADA